MYASKTSDAWDVGRSNHTTATSHGGNFAKSPEKQIIDKDDDQQQGGCCSAFVQCTQETSFTGFKYIGSNSGTFRRLFWLIIVFGAMAGLGFQLYRSTEKFVLRGTNTKLEYQTRPELDFPSVTICNSNMFRVTKLVEYYGGFWNVIIRGIHEVSQLFPKPGLTSQEADEEYNIDVYPGSLDLYDFIRDSAHTTEGMIKLCQYNGMPCGPENFTTTVTNFGVCFTFNSAQNNEKLTVTTPGQTQGLSLVLNAGASDVIAAPRENIGFKMLVHPRNEIPNLDDFGIELQPGTRTPIRIDVTEMTLLSDPYGECDIAPLKYFGNGYTEYKCYLECETDHIVKQCGCRNFYMPGNAPFCSPAQLRDCFYNESVIFSGNRIKLCSCPEACYERIYKPTLSQSSFPNYGVALTMQSREDHSILAVAFGEAVQESASGQIGQNYGTMYLSVAYTISEVANENGTKFTDLLPHAEWTFTEHVMNDIFGNMQFDMFSKFTESVYQETHLENLSMEYNSSRYWSEHSLYTERYIDSGTYKQTFANALLDYGVSPDGIGGQTFDDYVDSLYNDFYLKEAFYLAFNSIYNDTYGVVISHAHTVAVSSDLTSIATTYMMQNLLQVDVFYGDLKIESIEEQPSYELFQFVCDLGGALGLFFGASLLSFIETMDFWFTREGGCCGSSKKEEDDFNSGSMKKNKIDVHHEIITIS